MAPEATGCGTSGTLPVCYVKGYPVLAYTCHILSCTDLQCMLWTSESEDWGTRLWKNKIWKNQTMIKDCDTRMQGVRNRAVRGTARRLSIKTQNYECAWDEMMTLTSLSLLRRISRLGSDDTLRKPWSAITPGPVNIFKAFCSVVNISFTCPMLFGNRCLGFPTESQRNIGPFVCISVLLNWSVSGGVLSMSSA